MIVGASLLCLNHPCNCLKSGKKSQCQSCLYYSVTAVLCFRIGQWLLSLALSTKMRSLAFYHNGDYSGPGLHRLIQLLVPSNYRSRENYHSGQFWETTVIVNAEKQWSWLRKVSCIVQISLLKSRIYFKRKMYWRWL